MSLQKLLSLHKSMQVGVGVQSYKTDDWGRLREYNYSLKSNLNSVLNGTVHVPHWSGVVPPWSVMVLH